MIGNTICEDGAIKNIKEEARVNLKERVYSVLIVSSSEKFNTAIIPLLPESSYSPVCIVDSISSAKRAIAERGFDFVIINSPLPGDMGTRFAIDTSNSRNTIVLLMVKAEFRAEIFEKTAEHGVFLLSKPTAKPTLLMAFGWLASARERIRKTEKKTLSIEEKMEEIRMVNRAKWLLISELKLDEPSAHHYIEKQAMDRCISKKLIAEDIIRTYT